MSLQAPDQHLAGHLHSWLGAAQGAIEDEIQAALASQIEQIGLRRLRILQLVPAEGARQQELADLALVAKQSLAESVSVLEADGLVERQADPHDRRAWLVVPTPAGLRVKATLDTALTDVEAKVARAVGQQRYEEFRDVLQTIAAMEPELESMAGRRSR